MRLFALFSLLSGCYWAIGTTAVPKTPPLPEGQAIVMHEWQVTDTVHHVGGEMLEGTIIGGVTKHYDATLGTASYAGNPLTRAQLSMLTDPSWPKKIARVHDLHASCSRATTPEWIAVLGGLGAMVTTLVIGGTHKGEGSDVTLSSNEKLGLGVAAGMAGAGVVAYGVGFVIGGHACGTLDDARSELRLDSANSQYRDDELKLVQKLATDFNAAHHVTPPAAPEE